MNNLELRRDLIRRTDIGLGEHGGFNSASPRLCVQDAGAYASEGVRIYANAQGINAHVEEETGKIVRIVPGNSGVDVNGYVLAVPCVH
jgi:hypothetical protein